MVVIVIMNCVLLDGCTGDAGQWGGFTQRRWRRYSQSTWLGGGSTAEGMVMILSIIIITEWWHLTLWCLLLPYG